MSEPGGLLPLLTLDPGRGGRGSAFRLVTTGGMWNYNKDDPYDEKVKTTKKGAPYKPSEEWDKLMQENDPILLEPLGYDTAHDPPLIVSEEGFLLLKSSYDKLYAFEDPINPFTRKNNLYGIPGSTASGTLARKILFENGRVQVDTETRLVMTVEYRPPGMQPWPWMPPPPQAPVVPAVPGMVTVGPDEQREHAVRGQVWIWWYGGDTEIEVNSYRDYITLYIVAVLDSERIQRSRQYVMRGLSVTIGPAMDGIKHPGENLEFPFQHIAYRRVSFEYRDDFNTAGIIWHKLNMPPNPQEEWYELAWTYRWADMLTGAMTESWRIVKGLAGLGMNDEGGGDQWRFNRFVSAVDEGEDLPLPRASNNPSQPDALPGMSDGSRRYW